MTQITVENVLGKPYFSHDFDPGVTLIHGPHSGGKSSVATAIAALVAHEQNPLDFAKGDHKLYVTVGAAEARATLGAGEVVWTGKSMSVSPEAAERGPEALPYAVGLVDFLAYRRSLDDRARIWEALFLPPNASDVITPFWPGTKDQLKALIEQIDNEGWTKALKTYQQNRVFEKRRWCEVTGQARFGGAQSWKPKLWRDEIAQASEEQLEQVLADARDARNRLVAIEAVSQSEIVRAREIRDRELPRLRQEFDIAEGKFNAMKRKLEEADDLVATISARRKELWEEYSRLKQVKQAQAEHRCPVCDAGLVIEGGGTALHAWRAPEADQIALAEKRLPELVDAGEKTTQRLNLATSDRDAAFEALTRATEGKNHARTELAVAEKNAELADASAAEPPDPGDLERLDNPDSPGERRPPRLAHPQSRPAPRGQRRALR